MLLQRIITITWIYVLFFNGFINSTSSSTVDVTTSAEQNEATSISESTITSTVGTSSDSDTTAFSSFSGDTKSKDRTTSLSSSSIHNSITPPYSTIPENGSFSNETSTSGNASVDSTTPASNSSIPSTTTTTTTTVSTTTTSPNLKVTTNKYASMTLEEKQKRNGITSAIICIGSLILIGIACLSSYIDKPSEKVPKVAMEQFVNTPRKKDQFLNSNYKYDSEGQIIRDPNLGARKKISFDEASKFAKSETSGISHDIEMKYVKEEGTDKPPENQKKVKNTGKSGWDVLTQNPKFFDDYQPNRTNISKE